MADREIRSWFNYALRKNDPRPRDEILHALAAELKVSLHRANNEEERRQNGGTENPKDVCPNEILQELTSAIVTAASDYQSHFGDILPAPKGDVDLQDLTEQLLRVASFGPSVKKVSSRGHPPKPWKKAARDFASSVRHVLHQAGYRGPLSLSSATAPIVITAMAISWAYETALTPEGLLTALRDRNRSRQQIVLRGAEK